jgi:NADP-dependent 3-hydroxy acid dehydrogenase YdfG
MSRPSCEIAVLAIVSGEYATPKKAIAAATKTAVNLLALDLEIFAALIF